MSGLRAIQCDRCKKWFEYNKENNYLIELTDKVVVRSIDLCPECQKSFYEWIGDEADETQ